MAEFSVGVAQELADVTDAELEALIQSALIGDDSAFDRLAHNLRPALYTYLKRYLRRHEDIEDLLQETFLSAQQAMRSGHYQHINIPAFIGWLRKIAWHAVIYHNRSQEFVESFTYANLHENEVILDIPGPEGTAEHEVERLSLFEFLEQQLDKVLIQSESTQQGKDIGLLKKMAFMHFYVDQLSQKEIVAAVLEYAARLGIAAEVSQATINNWISRGDILKSLIRHLVEEHHELLSKLTDLERFCTSLNARERDLLQQNWELKKNEELIAQESGLPLSQVERTLRAAKRKVADALSTVIKQQLHDLRHRGNS